MTSSATVLGANPSGSRRFMNDPAPAPQGNVLRVERGYAYARVPLLSFATDSSEKPRYSPVTVNDEDDRPRNYLATRQAPGLVVAIFDDDLIWLAPILTEDDFEDRESARGFIGSVRDGHVGGWMSLPPMPQGPSTDIVVPLYAPTVILRSVLEPMLAITNQQPIGRLATRLLQQLDRSLTPLFIDQQRS